jgi:hypothetical protein
MFRLILVCFVSLFLCYSCCGKKTQEGSTTDDQLKTKEYSDPATKASQEESEDGKYKE